MVTKSETCLTASCWSCLRISIRWVSVGSANTVSVLLTVSAENIVIAVISVLKIGLKASVKETGKMKFYEYLEQENITPLDIITDAERMEDLCHKIEGCHECPLKIPSCYLDVECNDRERNLIENNMKRLMEKESKKKNKSKQKPAIGAEYYVPEIIDGKPDVFETEWSNDDIDNKRYEAGVVFTDKYEAIIVAKKMLAVAKERVKNE